LLVLNVTVHSPEYDPVQSGSALEETGAKVREKAIPEVTKAFLVNSRILLGDPTLPLINNAFDLRTVAARSGNNRKMTFLRIMNVSC
jgi:hypothetical protein